MNGQALAPQLAVRLMAIDPGRVFTGSDISKGCSCNEMPVYGRAVPEALVEAYLLSGSARAQKRLMTMVQLKSRRITRNRNTAAFMGRFT